MRKGLLHNPQAVAVFVAFGAFGAFWGTWGAAIPRIREQAAVNDAQLGVALLFVGAGALPAMLATGRASDRWKAGVPAGAITALGLSGLLVAWFAHDFLTLCIGLALIGAASGASDVAMNAMAGHAEQQAGRPLITRAHGVFSSFVVVSSISTGLLSGLAVPVTVAFGFVAVLSIVGGILVRKVHSAPGAGGTDTAPSGSVVPVVPVVSRALILIGLLGALAFASENAHQSWGAVFLEDELRAGTGISALAPAVFASVVAVTRFSIGSLQPHHAQRVLALGSVTAAAGALIISAAPSIAIAATGYALAAAGTAVLFPTLIGVLSHQVTAEHRGRAISMVSTVSYLGFLLGPVYVGLLSTLTGLRGAMIGVAALGAILLALAPAVLHRATIQDQHRSPKY